MAMVEVFVNETLIGNVTQENVPILPTIPYYVNVSITHDSKKICLKIFLKDSKLIFILPQIYRCMKREQALLIPSCILISALV